MTSPRVAIGIPHLDRTQLLERAIRSCLAQTVPVAIFIADQGGTEETRQLVRSLHIEHPDEEIVLFRTGAESLWENWDCAARCALTEFFMWLQDDDVIRPGVAQRVAECFDKFPESDLWMACNRIAIKPHLGWWNNGNGPWVLMDFMTGVPDQWEGEILVPTAYFTSWSLSPAVAFRNGKRFVHALDSVPTDCDLFAERTILAAMGVGGRFIADPITAGLWMQHGSNESRRQHADQPRQTRVLVEWLDDLMDQTEGWETLLSQWAACMVPSWIISWLGQLEVTQTEGTPGRYTERIGEILAASLEGRVSVVEGSELPVASQEEVGV